MEQWASGKGNPGVSCSKPPGGFHSTVVDQISTRNFQELSGKK